MNTREQDHVGRRLLRLARQLQRVSDEVGEILNLAVLIEVREDDGVPLSLELTDALVQIEGRRTCSGPLCAGISTAHHQHFSTIVGGLRYHTHLAERCSVETVWTRKLWGQASGLSPDT
jgi:hypothetical protein